MAGGKRGGQGGRGAKPGSHRKGAAVGSGGQKRKGLQGRGPTPPAAERKGHPAQGRARRAADTATSGRARPATGGRPSTARRPNRTTRPDADAPEIVTGRNPVVEALRASIPASALYVANGIEVDERVLSLIHI